MSGSRLLIENMSKQIENPRLKPKTCQKPDLIGDRSAEQKKGS
jgi:hypothetical protein